MHQDPFRERLVILIKWSVSLRIIESQTDIALILYISPYRVEFISGNIYI